jgi:hypothetical protein
VETTVLAALAFGVGALLVVPRSCRRYDPGRPRGYRLMFWSLGRPLRKALVLSGSSICPLGFAV